MSNSTRICFRQKTITTNLGFAGRLGYTGSGNYLNGIRWAKQRRILRTVLLRVFAEPVQYGLSDSGTLSLTAIGIWTQRRNDTNEHLATAKSRLHMEQTWWNSVPVQSFCGRTLLTEDWKCLSGNFSKNGFNFVFANSYLNSTSSINNQLHPSQGRFLYSSPKNKRMEIGTLFGPRNKYAEE